MGKIDIYLLSFGHSFGTLFLDVLFGRGFSTWFLNIVFGHCFWILFLDFVFTLDTTDKRWWILSTLNTANVWPTTLDLCCKPWALTTDLMFPLNFFISRSNLIVFPSSAKTCKEGLACLPYSQSLSKESVINYQIR